MSVSAPSTLTAAALSAALAESVSRVYYLDLARLSRL